DRLAAYLMRPARTERDKARAIYRWVTDRIAYDVDGYMLGKRGDNTAEGAFRTRKVVCEGYANLFERLCRHAGLEAVNLLRVARGPGLGDPLDVTRPNHAWNAVRLDGRWHLLDATWGAGSPGPMGAYDKQFEEFFFLTPPDLFVFSHYPMDPQWQLLSPAVPG